MIKVLYIYILGVYYEIILKPNKIIFEKYQKFNKFQFYLLNSRILFSCKLFTFFRSPQNHRVGVDGQDNQRCGNSLNVHGYLFNTPQEFK